MGRDPKWRSELEVPPLVSHSDNLYTARLTTARGCVTPQVLANVKETTEGDMDLMDGYEEVPEEWQEKFKAAVETGHVPDEDWRGDVEFNRPGKRGFRRKTPKKKKADEEDVSCALIIVMTVPDFLTG